MKAGYMKTHENIVAKGEFLITSYFSFSKKRHQKKWLPNKVK